MTSNNTTRNSTDDHGPATGLGFLLSDAALEQLVGASDLYFDRAQVAAEAVFADPDMDDLERLLAASFLVSAIETRIARKRTGGSGETRTGQGGAADGVADGVAVEPAAR